MNGAVTELIIATDPNLEGEATAAYLAARLATSPAWPSPGWPAGCRWAATSSTPTRSRWAGPSPAAGRCKSCPAAGGVAVIDQRPGKWFRAVVRRSSRRRCSQSARRSRATPRHVPACAASTMPTRTARTISEASPMARTAITVTTPARRIGYRWMTSSSSAFPSP